MTPQQLAALDFIRFEITTFGLAPSIEEIAAKLNVGKSGAHRVVSALVAAGKLKHHRFVARGIDLADHPDLRLVDSQAMRAELARRGETVEALAKRGPIPAKWNPGCAADGCQEPVTYGHLMCRRHWFMLPRGLQDALKAASARGDRGRFGELLVKARDLTAERRQAMEAAHG